MGIEKEFGEQRNGGEAVQSIYLARRLNDGRRKESVAGNDDHLGWLGVRISCSAASEGTPQSLLHAVSCVCACGVWGCTGKERCSGGVEEWG
jgi:hypothetical protein